MEISLIKRLKYKFQKVINFKKKKKSFKMKQDYYFKMINHLLLIEYF